MYKRKHFLFQNQPVMAAGVILYKYENQTPYFLLQHKQNGYQDLGGKVENTDTTVQDTIAREAAEETNQLLDQEEILSRLSSQEHDYYYVKHSKYLFTIIQATEKEGRLGTADFGNEEQGQKVTPRQVHWVPLSALCNGNLFCRLHSPQFLVDLAAIQRLY